MKGLLLLVVVIYFFGLWVAVVVISAYLMGSLFWALSLPAKDSSTRARLR